MKKQYEVYAEQVKGCNRLYSDAVKGRADELNRINSDENYSPIGKQAEKQKIYNEIQNSADNMTNIVKEACKRFIADFGITLPEDNKDHGIDIQNALRVIDMLGYNLDEKNLKNILNPLKGSYKNLKTVIDVIRTKDRASEVLHYSRDVMRVIDETSGFDTSVTEYLDYLNQIQGLVDNPIGYGFDANVISNSPIVHLEAKIPYSFMACPDWMNEAGEMYSKLEDEFNKLFVVHIPTDQEMIEDILK